jgi:hypothetical protein
MSNIRWSVMVPYDTDRALRSCLRRTKHITRLCLFCLLAGTVIASPGQQTFFSCTDYHCDTGEMVTLTAGQWQSVRDLFAADVSAAEERKNIRQAIALLENTVGTITGTWRDLAGNVTGAGQSGQLDCISESINTTAYLQLLFDDGLLRWHDIEERQVRHPLIFNVHWTAVIVDHSSGARFAVDSWFLDNGQPPGIQPLGDWLAGRRVDESLNN